MHGRKRRSKEAKASVCEAEKKKEQKLVTSYQLVDNFLNLNRSLTCRRTSKDDLKQTIKGLQSSSSVPEVSEVLTELSLSGKSQLLSSEEHNEGVTEDAIHSLKLKSCGTVSDSDAEHSVIDKQLLSLEQAIAVNPEIQSLWNLRKKLYILKFKHIFNTPWTTDFATHRPESDYSETGSATTTDSKKVVEGLVEEMIYTAKVLQICPKVYCVWYHRLWLLKQVLLIALFGARPSVTHKSSGSSISCELDLGVNKPDKTTTNGDKRDVAIDNRAVRHNCGVTSVRASSSCWRIVVAVGHAMNELKLCDEFLKYDERNFHCWNHRSFLCSFLRLLAELNDCIQQHQDKECGSSPDRGQTCPEDTGDNAEVCRSHNAMAIFRHSVGSLRATLYNKKCEHTNILAVSDVAVGEVDFFYRCFVESDEDIADDTEDIDLRHHNLDCLDIDMSKKAIEASFSNYSAWHLRSRIPTALLPLRDEIEWVRQGLYTEPADQSLWQYYWWLVLERSAVKQNGSETSSSTKTKPDHDLLEKELGETEQLLELEAGCKYAILTK
eukprot:GHVQ01023692.1.p1 GENE.GHVQ01023692.1~~GHVQ01023692.1.p1  ORF type:complete len:551 (-),score=81.09 GHVQ01023692.1:3129-4781(-)